jgi:hypothetical protein
MGNCAGASPKPTTEQPKKEVVEDLKTIDKDSDIPNVLPAKSSILRNPKKGTKNN